MSNFKKISPPSQGEAIVIRNGKLIIPSNPIVPFIPGDGTGPDIWRATRLVIDKAVEVAYEDLKKISWFQIHAGLSALRHYGGDNILPDDTIEAIKVFKVAIKGPLTTPIGAYPFVCLECAREQGNTDTPRPEKCPFCGSPYITKRFKSLNVAFRQILDLYTCIRPVRWFAGVPSPVKEPDKLNVVIFRENTEDVYAGIEFPSNSNEAIELITLLNERFSYNIRLESGIGIKPISPFASKRLIKKAILYAIQHNIPSVTIVHKGNIMKFTEGAFRDWGYELAAKEFADIVVAESDYNKSQNTDNRIIIKDRIADQMFQQILLRPEEYHVIATPNLNGDYLSDACAAQVGGLGMAPGANIGDEIALFEATHGSAPKYTGQDKVNPSSLILSGVLLLEHMGWQEAADLIINALEKTIAQKLVTYDLERQMEGAKLLKTSEFAAQICQNIPKP